MTAERECRRSLTCGPAIRLANHDFGKLWRGMRNWKDAIELDWTLRDIYAGRLKMSPITEDQLSELLELGFVEVVNDQVKLTEAGYRKIH